MYDTMQRNAGYYCCRCACLPPAPEDPELSDSQTQMCFDSVPLLWHAISMAVKPSKYDSVFYSYAFPQEVRGPEGESKRNKYNNSRNTFEYSRTHST